MGHTEFKRGGHKVRREGLICFSLSLRKWFFFRLLGDLCSKFPGTLIVTQCVTANKPLRDARFEVKASVEFLRVLYALRGKYFLGRALCHNVIQPTNLSGTLVLRSTHPLNSSVFSMPSVANISWDALCVTLWHR